MSSAVDAEAPLLAELALDLGHPTETLETVGVLASGTGFEHAGEVDDRGDLRPHRSAEVLAPGVPADVLVSRRPPRGGHEA